MRQCECGGIVRQHQLSGEREAWTCGSCGRYEVVSNFENWFVTAIRIAIETNVAPPFYVWDLGACDDWRAMHSGGMTPFSAVQAMFTPVEVH